MPVYATAVAFDALLEVLTGVESWQTEGCCADDGDASGINRDALSEIAVIGQRIASSIFFIILSK